MTPFKTNRVLMVLAILSLGLTACFPGDSLTTDELDVISTDYDPAYFQANDPMTYFMPDSVGVLGSDDPEYALPREDQEFILNLIEQNMTDFGYTRIFTPIDNPPDVVLLASYVSTRFTGSGGCIPWYPGWGWGGWWPGWGWGPGYCYPSYVYSYTTGTLVMDLLPQDQSDGDEELELVWHAGMNGLVRSSEAAGRNALTRAINQAYSQSAFYLKRN